MDPEAPYLRIAAEIRDRIARGTLKPGERVPSTRQITQRWGVAMATATKVIAVLREEGLVDPRPGAGTVVRAAPSPTAPPARTGHDLNRDRIIATAITIADDEGLPQLSMRRVATDLGVATMSLYRHVPGKEELLELMADTVVAEQRLPINPPPHWRARLDLAAHLLWSIFRRHPWVAEVVSLTRPQFLPNLLDYAEWVLSALRGIGLNSQDMMHAHLTLFWHLRGTALSIQSERTAEQDTGMTNEEWLDNNGSDFTAVVTSGRYPALTYVSEHGFDYDIDQIFEFGLQRFLDGLAATLTPPGQASR